MLLSGDVMWAASLNSIPGLSSLPLTSMWPPAGGLRMSSSPSSGEPCTCPLPMHSGVTGRCQPGGCSAEMRMWWPST